MSEASVKSMKEFSLKKPQEEAYRTGQRVISPTPVNSIPSGRRSKSTSPTRRSMRHAQREGWLKESGVMLAFRDRSRDHILPQMKELRTTASSKSEVKIVSCSALQRVGCTSLRDSAEKGLRFLVKGARFREERTVMDPERSLRSRDHVLNSSRVGVINGARQQGFRKDGWMQGSQRSDLHQRVGQVHGSSLSVSKSWSFERNGRMISMSVRRLMTLSSRRSMVEKAEKGSSSRRKNQAEG